MYRHQAKRETKACPGEDTQRRKEKKKKEKGQKKRRKNVDKANGLAKQRRTCVCVGLWARKKEGEEMA